MKRPLQFVTLLLALLALAAAPDPSPVYTNDFAKADLGKPAKEFLTLAGAFEVKDVDGNRLLELPGEPLETFGTMFGPAEHNLVDVRAKVWAATSGKRYPEFGIGAADVSGYRLWLVPRQRRLVIRKSDEEVASVPFESWQSDTWTQFRLTIEPAGDAWRITGSARPADGDAAKATTVTYDEKQKPAAGRGSVWGAPFSSKPIRYDDIEVRVMK